MEIRFGIKPIPIWILVGRWCPAAGGAAAPPYRGFGLLDEWRSDSSALPCRFGYWWGGGAPPLAERQLRPTGGLICWTNGGATVPPYRIWIVVGRWCPAAGGAAVPPYRGFGLLDEWRSDSSALPCRFGYWWGGGAPPLAEQQLRPTGGLVCWTNGGAAVPPYLADLDIGGAAVPRRRRSGSSALPGVGFVGRMAERQLPPYRIWIVVGRRCPAAGGTAVPPRRGFGLLDEWRSGSSALPDLDCGGAVVPRRRRNGSSALPGVWFVGRMAERQLRPTLPIWILVGRRCPAASGATVPPYLADLDIGRAVVPRRRRNGSSAPPGVWFVGRMAERQLRPTGFGLWWGGGAPPPAERQLRPTGGLVCWTNGGATVPPYLADLDIGGAAVPRRWRSGSSALPGV